MTASFETIIVGLGAVGSAAAYHLARRGCQVLGLDRYAPPHTLGSSHGESRIVRQAYFEGADYLPLLARAWRLWHALEEESGRSLVTRCGVLNIGPRSRPLVAEATRSAETLGVAHEVLTPDEVRQRFPAFRLPAASLALLEVEAGLISPEAGVHAQLEGARRHGAHLRFDERVRRWHPSGPGVTVVTDRRTYHSGRLILAAGGWTAGLAGDLRLPLQVQRVTNAWFRPRANPSAFGPSACPAFIWEYRPDAIAYGLPDLGRGVKAGLHYHGPVVAQLDAAEREASATEVEAIRGVVTRLLPDVDGPASTTSVCFYTNTPDKDYLVDRHPRHPAVIYASACSGHGFKAAPAVGEALADLATDQPPSCSLEAFRFRW